MAELSTTVWDERAGHKDAQGRKHIMVLLAFLCIYLVWGSTYLAIRYAVETIPPLLVAGLRHLLAGGLLFAWCWRRGLHPRRQQWLASIVLGALFFLIGHGTLHWAGRVLPSGLAALLIATEPMWVAIMAIAVGQARITTSLLTGLVLGAIGVALLIQADMKAGQRVWMSSVAVLIGAFSWAAGMIYSRNSALHPVPVMSAAMSLLAGAVLLLLAGILTGEAARFTLAAVSLKSLLGLGYLAIVGSLIGYSAYFWLLQRCPPALVATHIYVNPIVALILGWAVAGEVLSGRTLLSGAAVICAIALVSRGSRLEARGDREQQQQEACSASGLERRTV